MLRRLSGVVILGVVDHNCGSIVMGFAQDSLDPGRRGLCFKNRIIPEPSYEVMGQSVKSNVGSTCIDREIADSLPPELASTLRADMH